jgi:menaquinone-specific isochorismate synthase
MVPQESFGTVTRNTLQIENWLREGALLGSQGQDLQLAVGPFTLTSTIRRPRSIWLNPDFFLGADSASSAWEGSQDLALNHSNFEKSIQPFASPPKAWRWNPPSFESFRGNFEAAQQAFAKGALNKIVPVVFASADVEVTPSLLAFWLSQALASGVQGHLFGKWNLKEGWGVLGLTPEVLFVRRGASVHSMALAGTAQNAQHDLIRDEKEMAEHQIVVCDLSERLKPFGSVRLSTTHVWQPSQLRHLRTDLELNLSNAVDDYALLKALHPTPALGGHPREEALSMLQKWDAGVERGCFGAPFGRLASDLQMCEFVVAIRCLIWSGGRLRIGSGCGLVSQSQLMAEWSELERKRESVMKTFGVAW